jgi:predicted hotdog family 3-hydroxylacyl-ACP dehydratase
MCLLDTVEEWSDTHLICRTATHRAALNPLRRGDQLEAICGLEYAAQAMAAHIGILLRADHPPLEGYLIALRDLVLRRSRLDDIADDLTIVVRRVVGEDPTFIYTFWISADRQVLLNGRATIFLTDGKRLP